MRGALNKLASLSPEEWARGVVTASAGNHGLGVAYASAALGLPPVTIFVPDNAARTKVERLARSGCEIRRAGADYDATHALAEAYAQERGALYLSAYDDPLVIAGQGTAGLEIMEDLPDADDTARAGGRRGADCRDCGRRQGHQPRCARRRRPAGGVARRLPLAARWAALRDLPRRADDLRRAGRRLWARAV